MTDISEEMLARACEAYWAEEPRRDAGRSRVEAAIRAILQFLPTDTYRVRELEWREIREGRWRGSGYDCVYLFELRPSGKYALICMAPHIAYEMERRFNTPEEVKFAANEHHRQRVADMYLEAVR